MDEEMAQLWKYVLHKLADLSSYLQHPQTETAEVIYIWISNTVEAEKEGPWSFTGPKWVIHIVLANLWTPDWEILT